MSRNADDIYNITRVIGDLLRYSISNEGGLVKLEEELKHVRNYVFIQENRFLGRCTVVTEADEFSRASLLPRFTLQPLVENAFEHGLQPQRGQWRLLIRIRTVGSRTVFMVKDEGVGMTPERLEEIRAALRGMSRCWPIPERESPGGERASACTTSIHGWCCNLERSMECVYTARPGREHWL